MKKILIIDDEPVIRETLGRFLRTMDYEILFAQDGLEGLEKTKAFHPNLVIVDILMPRMDGFSFCSILKKDTKTARIPVLFLTGQGRLGDAEMALAEGAGGFLTKPFDFSRIMEKVESLLK